MQFVLQLIEGINLPLVSILVPVYNVEKYLNECMDSLISQTLQDIEIICVNDGSTDKSLEILNQYATKDPRIKIISKCNGGLPSARNVGLDNAKGEYVGFVDSDDYVDSRMFETLYNLAKKNNSEVIVCGATPFPEDPKPSKWLIEALSPRDIYYPRYCEDLLFIEKSSPFIWRLLVKRDLIERNHIRLDESISIGEDQAFQFKIYPLAKGIYLTSKKLYNYRWWREGSLMNQDVYSGLIKKFGAHTQLIKSIVNNWNKDNIENNLMMIMWIAQFVYGDFIQLPYNIKITYSRIICSALDDLHYPIYNRKLDIVIQEQCDYFYQYLDKTAEETKLSIVVTVDSSSKDAYTRFEELLAHSSNTEIICINNGVTSQIYSEIHKIMRIYPKLRVINQDVKSDIATEIIGANIAVSKYIYFVNIMDECNIENYCRSIEEVQQDSYDLIKGRLILDPKELSSIIFNNFDDCSLNLNQYIIKKEYYLNVVNTQRDYAYFNHMFTSYLLLTNTDSVHNVPYLFSKNNKKMWPSRIQWWQSDFMLLALMDLIYASYTANTGKWIIDVILEILDSESFIELITDANKILFDSSEDYCSQSWGWTLLLQINNELTKLRDIKPIRLLPRYVFERNKIIMEFENSKN